MQSKRNKVLFVLLILAIGGLAALSMDEPKLVQTPVEQAIDASAVSP